MQPAPISPPSPKTNRMPTLHIFNPSHDEALAFGRADYCPSRAARRLGDVLADLPRWWATEDDEMLRLPEAMGLDAVAPPDWRRIDRIEPWGWDAHIVGVLQRLGAPERLLPDALRLAHLRSLSSRQSTTRFLHALNDEVLPVGVLKGNSWWCTTFAEVKSALAHCSGEAMVKQPWSSSGRGVFPCNSDLPTPLLARIKKQSTVRGRSKCNLATSVWPTGHWNFRRRPMGGLFTLALRCLPPPRAVLTVGNVWPLLRHWSTTSSPCGSAVVHT